MWVKAFFHIDNGLCIGKDDDENVYYNVATGQLIVERVKGEAHVATLDQYANYRLRFFDNSFLSEIEKEACPVKEKKEINQLAKDVAPTKPKGKENGSSGRLVKNA